MAMIEAATEEAIEVEHNSEVEPGFPPHLMTLERFERLVESGIFADESPVFLWYGRLVEKMAPGTPHIYVVSTLDRFFILNLPREWVSYQEAPIAIGGDSLPEPDISVVRGTLADYREKRPKAADVGLIIEVADSSLRFDKREVLKTYAAAGIPTYWIVNLQDRWIEVYTDPTGPAERPTYRIRRDYGPNEEVPVVLGGIEMCRIACQDLFA